jgi:tRNA (guanine37-N1)-methyltransferase
MVMKPDVWGQALDDIAVEQPTLIVPTPAGKPFTQAVATDLAAAQHLVFACGRYEGIDQRVIIDAADRMPVLELSIGDYVLAGGEVAAMVMIEAITRLIPGVLGNPESAGEDSFSGELTDRLEAPSYTRPPVYRGIPVPAVLTSGDHAAVAAYRRAESLRRTEANRPDLFS